MPSANRRSRTSAAFSSGVVARKVDTLSGESLSAGAQGFYVEGLFLFHGEVLAEIVEDGFRVLGAIEDGLGGPDAALIEHDHVALFEEAQKEGELVQGGLDDAGAGSAREIDKRVGGGVAGRRPEHHDVELDRARIRV